MCNTDRGDFWKKIGSIGVTQEWNRMSGQVVNDGMVSQETKMVAKKWHSSFKDLLNPTPTEMENMYELD